MAGSTSRYSIVEDLQASTPGKDDGMGTLRVRRHVGQLKADRAGTVAETQKAIFTIPPDYAGGSIKFNINGILLTSGTGAGTDADTGVMSYVIARRSASAAIDALATILNVATRAQAVGTAQLVDPATVTIAPTAPTGADLAPGDVIEVSPVTSGLGDGTGNEPDQNDFIGSVEIEYNSNVAYTTESDRTNL